MAFPYYPNYNQLFLQQQLQNMQQQPQQQNIQNNTQIQNGGFVLVKNEAEAMNYPVAPGNSVTFKNESQPYIYTKTLGFSQLDQPIFEVFKLVKEEKSEPIADVVNDLPAIEYLTLEDADKIKAELESLKSEIDFLKEYIESDTKEVEKEI